MSKGRPPCGFAQDTDITLRLMAEAGPCPEQEAACTYVLMVPPSRPTRDAPRHR